MLKRFSFVTGVPIKKLKRAYEKLPADKREESIRKMERTLWDLGKAH